MSDPDEEKPELPLLGVDFVFDMGIRKIEEQLKEIEALDLKIGILFGFLGTVLVALLAVVFTAAPQSVAAMGWPEPPFLLIGLISIGLAIYYAFRAFLLRQYYGIPSFSDLSLCAKEDPKKSKGAFLDLLLLITEGNLRRLTDKQRYARSATWSVLIAFFGFLFAIIAVVIRNSTGL